MRSLDEVRASDDEVRTALAGIPEGVGLREIVAELSGLATSLQQEQCDTDARSSATSSSLARR